MKRSGLAEAQIVMSLRLPEAGMSLDDLCRQHEIVRSTIHQRRGKYGGLVVRDDKKALEDENRRLQWLVADLALDEQMPQDVLSRKWRSPPHGRVVSRRARPRPRRGQTGARLAPGAPPDSEASQPRNKP